MKNVFEIFHSIEVVGFFLPLYFHQEEKDNGKNSI
jgi:hypothetical protein